MFYYFFDFCLLLYLVQLKNQFRIQSFRDIQKYLEIIYVSRGNFKYYNKICIRIIEVKFDTKTKYVLKRV